MKWIKKYSERMENKEEIIVGLKQRSPEKNTYKNRIETRNIAVQIKTPKDVVERMIEKYGVCYTFFHPKWNELKGMIDGLVEIYGKSEVEKKLGIKINGKVKKI